MAVDGYAILTKPSGKVIACGGAVHLGDLTNIAGHAPAVDIAFCPGGYWIACADGGVFSFGAAKFLGSMGGQPLNKPIIGMAATPTGNGYWLVGSDGGVFCYGDAGFYGSTGSVKLVQPIVAMVPTITGHGYWLVAADGGIFNYGDATFHGSAAGFKLAKPIVDMAATSSGKGYWLFGRDGGVFAFGDAPAVTPEAFPGDISSGVGDPDGSGVLVLKDDGAVWSVGKDIPFYGSAFGMLR